MKSTINYINDDDDDDDNDQKRNSKATMRLSSPTCHHHDSHRKHHTNLPPPLSSSLYTSTPIAQSTLASLDLKKIDMVIHTHVLSNSDNDQNNNGRIQANYNNNCKDPTFSTASTPPPRASSSSSSSIISTITQRIITSLSVALTNSCCNFTLREKLVSPVQEIVNFFTDAQV